MNNINFSDLLPLSPEPCAPCPSPRALSSEPSSDIKNTHINIGTGKDLTIKDLALLIKGIIGFDGNLNWDSSKPDGTFRKLLDVTKMKKLGWKGRIGLEKGIEMVYTQYSKF